MTLGLFDSDIGNHRFSGCGAILSPCRRYRYVLWRSWGDVATLGYVVFVGLNPSTADERADDPTIRRCVGFAKAWGMGGLVMLNAFAFRATDPADMLAASDPVGPDNDRWLQDVAGEARISVAAWGKLGSHMGRDKQVRAMIPRMQALRFNKDGSPAHPLYLPASLTPIAFPG